MLLRKLIPREANFFDLFNEHGNRIVEGSRAFMAMVTNYEDPDLRKKYADEVDVAERSADRITAEVIRQLHKTFITPIDRAQILGLINAMDDVLDLLQDATETMSLYDLRHMTDEVRRLGDISARCCERVQYAVTLLPNVDDASVADAAMKTCDEIDQLESDADRAMRTGITKLFRDEADVRQLIKMKGIYELLESVTDRAEDVANIIEGIILENS